MTSSRPPGWRRRVAAAALAALVAACGDAAAATKSGGPAPPAELVLRNYDSGGNLEAVPAIAWFVDRVAELSEGRLVVRVDVPDWSTEGRELVDVAAGDADLGWVGTRAVDLLGVDEFRPLHAPLLVDSYELQAAIVGSDVATRMLAGLERLGVEPLALLADELRFPVAVERPLLAPQDWADARVWLLESGAYADAVEALGGTPLHTFATGEDIRLMLQEGDADGHESMWVYYTLGADYLHTPYVAANVSLGPRTLALFANPEALADLDERAAGWVRQAALEAAAWSALHAADGVVGYVADACRYGARVAFASPAQLAALRVAAEPAYERLRADEATAGLLADIEALRVATVAGPGPAVPAACRYEPGEEALRAEAPPPLTGPGPTGAFPLGTYRYRLAAADVVSGQEVLGLAWLAGVVTWELGAGEWTLTLRPDRPEFAPVVCHGWYAVDGQDVVFGYRPVPDHRHCAPMRWTSRWSVDDAGHLRWDPPEPSVLVPHFNEVWRRVG